MRSGETARKQFNLQAANFDSWETPKNREYLQGLSAMLSLSPDDMLLDVASGTGEFVTFCGPLVKRAIGIDISDALIALSCQRKLQAGLTNVDFHLGDAERLPFSNSSFDVVICKSAFHHLLHSGPVFAEMLSCCKTGGTIAICDIIAHEDPDIDAFFEEFEQLVDASHARTLSGIEFEELFRSNNIVVAQRFELEIRHTIAEYLTHACQTESALLELDALLVRAKSIPGLPDYWNVMNGSKDEMEFRRKVVVLVGKKSVP